ncbi:MAG: DUF2778 domain-containing protein [Syntrophobacterales bacterium]|nr:DUF2778 domain-containing protein [Syntrophobacterales bacterium]
MDNRIDDEVFCNGVRRGEFRLHPGGSPGRSSGCVTLPNSGDFRMLRHRIIAQRCIIPGHNFEVYGVLNSYCVNCLRSFVRPFCGFFGSLLFTCYTVLLYQVRA